MNNKEVYIFSFWFAMYLSTNIAAVYLNIIYLPGLWLFLGYTLVSTIGMYHEFKDFRNRLDDIDSLIDVKTKTPPIESQFETDIREGNSRISDDIDYF